MTADINVILQLLQRQNAPVPPAYSTVSSTSLLPESTPLYGSDTAALHSMFPITSVKMETAQVSNQTKDIKKYFNRCLKKLFCLNFRGWNALMLNSPKSPRSLCPAASIWLQPLMTQWPWRSLLKRRHTRAWPLSCLNSRSNPPSVPDLPRNPVFPQCRGTWTCLQNRARCRNTPQTRHCRSPESQGDFLLIACLETN